MIITKKEMREGEKYGIVTIFFFVKKAISFFFNFIFQ
jgi:hypothetical protein